MLSSIRQDLGIDPRPEGTPKPVQVTAEPILTFGEHARERREKAALQAAAPSAAKTAEETPAPAVEPPKAPETTAPEVKVHAPEPDLKKLVDEAVESRLNTPAYEPPRPDPVVEPSAPVTDPFEEQLTDVEREKLELARYAAKSDPKFKAVPEQMLKYFKDADAMLRQKQKEAEEKGEDFNEKASQEVQEWLEDNMPRSFTPSVQKRFERQLIAEDAERRVESRYNKRLQEMEDRQRSIETAPIIDRTVNEFSNGLFKNLVALDPAKSDAARIAKEAQEKGWETVEAADQIFAPIVKRGVDYATKLTREYLQIANGTRKVEENNPDHVWLARFLISRENAIVNGDTSAKVRRTPDGRSQTFVPRAQLRQVLASNPAKAADYWTFDDSDMVQMIQQNASADISNRVAEMQKRLSTSGYAKKNGASSDPKIVNKENAQPAQSPRTVAQPAAGSTVANNTPPKVSAMSEKDMALLGVKPYSQ